MIGLLVKYRADLEVLRIKSTLSRMEWYKGHGYKPRLPEGVSESNVEEVVKKEFKVEGYGQAEEELTADFGKIPERFFSMLEEKAGKKLPEVLEVTLTKYGVGGSYNLPNRIIINIAGGRAGQSLIDCLKHELIHLMVEDEVQNKKLSQKEKEELVNDIFEEIN